MISPQCIGVHWRLVLRGGVLHVCALLYLLGLCGENWVLSYLRRGWPLGEC